MTLTAIRPAPLMDMDSEANVFAAYLLMPEAQFSAAIAGGINLDDDKWVERLAKKFRVPIGAVIFRLMLEGQF
jgi:Zn-dependent peptidase ImmA (M78 family)